MRVLPLAPAPALVGREREVAVLLERLEAARRGEGAIALLAGEPGIGKTRLARELVELARGRGFDAFWGACEGASRPYGPWLELANACAGSLPGRILDYVDRSSASVLAELVQPLHEMVPGTAVPAVLPPDEARIRLREALARFFIALDRPLVLVLDDLHAADESSLDQLRHLARSVADSRLLVVSSYRDEMRREAVGSCLAELMRLRVCELIRLTSLNENETRCLAEAVYSGELDPGVVAAVYRDTGGNPFFVEEVARHLRDEGAAADVPDTVRLVVTERMARLSSDARRLLTVASAFGAQFGLPVLDELVGLSERRLLAALDGVLAASFLRPAGGETYEFAHSLVRHAVDGELSPSRRARLHRRVARALEQVYAGRELEVAGELARQYRDSAGLPGVANGIPYAVAAAAQARAVCSYEEEAAFLRIARDLGREAEAGVRATVLTNLAHAEIASLQLDAARSSVEDALACIGDDCERVASFLGDACWALRAAGAPRVEIEPLVRRGIAAANGGDLVSARLELVLEPLEARSSGGLHFALWRGHDQEAVAIARASEDEQDYARTLSPYDRRTREELEDLLELVRGWSHPPARIHGLSTVAASFVYWPGELRRAAAVAEELLVTSEEYGSIVGQAYALVLLAELKMAFGEFELARTIENRAHALAARVGPEHRIRRLVDNAGEIAFVLAGGDWAVLAERYGAISRDASLRWGTGQLGAGALAVYALAQLGRREEVEGLLEDFTPALHISRPTDLAHGGCVCNISGAIWDLELRPWAGTYRQLALELLDAGLGDLSGHSQELAVARMAGLEGDLDEAFAYFARARSVLDRSGQRPLRAVVDHDEAVLRARHGLPGGEALAGVARAEFARIGMTMWLERADALAATLRRQPPHRLSRRELEVLRLVGAGRTNKEIAGELVISIRTVERHVLNAYAKIGARRRADAIAYALQHRL